MSKHTPGPWECMPEECHIQYIRIRGTSLGDRYKIANVLTPNYDNVTERDADETRANARLISAAPELLNALRAFVEHGSCYDAIDMNNARAAIAKATGAL